MYTDLLTQIKNSQMVKKERLKVPCSKINEAVLKILSTNHYISKFEKKGRGVAKILEIKLKYSNNEGAISGFKFLSKPSRRLYIGYKEIRPVKSGYGLVVISTPEGIMTGNEARKKKVGGEALFQIW
ncbi:MAG: 30S ribosomal protein S8 [Patescibacteria group bacterium]